MKRGNRSRGGYFDYFFCVPVDPCFPDTITTRAGDATDEALVEEVLATESGADAEGAEEATTEA